MSEIDTTTPVAEVPATPEPTAEKTIGEVIETPVVDKQNDSVPTSAFLKEKMARKEAEKRIKELEDNIRNGATKSEVRTDIASIAKEFDVDPTFLDKIASTIRSETEASLRNELESKFKPLEEKERQAKIDSAFNAEYSRAMSAMPEFSDIVNPAVIKSLSLLPQNGNKTMSQLIEETYGSALTGKRTMTPTVPGGGKDPQPLDYARAQKDKAYFKEVMSDPKLKEEYNSIMLRQGW